MTGLAKYLSVVGIGLQNTLVYRVNFLFRAVFGFIPLLGTIFLWRAVYAGKEEGSTIAAYGLSGMISYYLMVTIVDALTAVNEDDWQIAGDIKDGNISQFLLKPVDYLFYRLSLFAAGRLIYFVMAVVPVSVFIWCFRSSFVLPTDGVTAAWFGLSVFLTALLQFFMSYATAMLAFWVLEVSTFIFIVFAFEYIASGHLFPLNLLPPAVQEVVMFTPFPFQMYFPVSIYLGQTTGEERLWGLVIQFCWVVIFYFIARFMWERGIRKYSAVGG
jgi:ABC-2 type transport system permease protein